MYCSQCGTKLPVDAKYCPQCGRFCAGDSSELPRGDSPPASASAPAPAPPTGEPPADRTPSDLRLLLRKVWGSYGILEQNTNDVDGITRQLKNRVQRQRLEYLPDEATVTELLRAIEASLSNPNGTRTRKELEMAAALPDLRARQTYQIEAVDEGSGYEYEKDVLGERNIECEAVRRLAAELLR